MSEHLNILVQPGSRATPIHSAGDALCTIKNTSLTDNVYLSTDVSININGTRFTTLRPLGTITLTGEVNTNAVTLTNPFNVLSSFTLPDGILFQGTQAANGYPTGNYGISGLPLTGTILKAVTGFSDPQMLLLTDGGAGQHGQQTIRD